MLYCCETCGEKFISEEKALECEQIHREEKARQEELAKEKEVRFAEIETDWNNLFKKISDYQDDYGNIPVLKVHKDNRNILSWMYAFL